MPNIEFKNIETIDSSSMAVAFPATLDGVQIRCAISTEALQDHFNSISNDQLSVFRSNRYSIESKARELIVRSRYETDGSILVRVSDFQA
jgi:hypothetical protein